MAARTKSRVTPKYKTKYRVKNWAVYEESPITRRCHVGIAMMRFPASARTTKGRSIS